ncbi:Rubisco methyltransferase family protein [Gossypium australe]|uniref:Rubisco methyltransferase family protein n=1 Tax=Gossypium australe TaxID=47621 RepID=A0A5B6UMD2_9ROSI|nr:Rubisco methyltransferase family protein [Gossypium australe]
MSHSGDDSFSDAAEECYNAEFRSYPDDAWYNVRVLFAGNSSDKMRVKYDNFSDDYDNVFIADSFKSAYEVYDFIGRFRKASAQLQDPDCSMVVKGMRICASDSFGNDDVRFYDAIIDEVLHKKHSYVNGQEECECTFLISWLHGPNVGNITDKGVANICLLQGSEIPPKLASFIEIALQKIDKALCKSVSGTSNDLVALHKDNKGSPIVKWKPSSSECIRQRKCAPRSLSVVWPLGGIEFGCASKQEETDLGGDKNLHKILVQNLEKELSSSTVSEFIHKQTSITTRVYIFPSLPWEPYTNGVIMLNCQKDLERLLGFLQNPNHFIVSLNGRPWVATEKLLNNDHWTLMLGSPNKLLNRKVAGFNNELKVVCCGTKEYNKAKELRDLFLQFIEHQRGLHKKLRMEERNIS